jgi:hypothetical protein
VLPVWLRNFDNALLLSCEVRHCSLQDECMVWCHCTGHCRCSAVLWQQQQEHGQEQGTAASGLYAYRYLQTWQVLLCVCPLPVLGFPQGEQHSQLLLLRATCMRGAAEGAHMRLVCERARGSLLLLPLLQACGGVQAQPPQLHEQVTASAWHWSDMP